MQSSGGGSMSTEITGVDDSMQSNGRGSISIEITRIDDYMRMQSNGGGSISTEITGVDDSMQSNGEGGYISTEITRIDDPINSNGGGSISTEISGADDPMQSSEEGGGSVSTKFNGVEDSMQSNGGGSISTEATRIDDSMHSKRGGFIYFILFTLFSFAYVRVCSIVWQAKSNLSAIMQSNGGGSMSTEITRVNDSMQSDGGEGGSFPAETTEVDDSMQSINRGESMSAEITSVDDSVQSNEGGYISAEITLTDSTEITSADDSMQSNGGGCISTEITVADDSKHSNGGGSISIEMSRIHDYFPTVQYSKYCIQRVDNQLRTVNEKAYEPEIIAIGPYHRGKNNLKRMEQQKLYYLKSLVERRGESVEVYFEAVRQLEDQARKCYAELPELTSDEFVGMLVLDGCFIAELFIRFETKNGLDDINDEIFQNGWILTRLQRDLLLFENQIPFCVLFKLFKMIDVNEDLIELAMRFFEVLLPGAGFVAEYEGNRLEETIHLLGLIHDNWLPNFPMGETTAKNKQYLKLIRSATELREAGVMFEKAVKKKADDRIGLLDIKFRGGTLQIPRLVIEDRTECFFRNLIAYELHYQNPGHRHIISYVKFLDCLIKSPRDVEVLCRRGIIHNMTTDEAVSQIFNKINESITDPGINFHYIEVFNEVNGHCRRRRNRWMAKLRHEYLHSPWGYISVIAACLFLVLTLVQTFYAILSYNNKKSA